MQACLRALTNLRQLKANLPTNPDTLAALQSLTGLTQLHLVGQCLAKVHCTRSLLTRLVKRKCKLNYRLGLLDSYSSRS